MTSINNKDLIKIIEEVVENNKELAEIVFDIVVKINNLPSKAKASIAQLINYNPESSLVSPLLQGQISRYVKMVCKEIGIELEKANDDIGGLAYFNEFIKN
ncbi:MAG: hypothetical protein E7359_04370 [Clostridiales bacterium]|nr:hypothetical protein [Clostridiales bacterium]